MNIRTSLNPMLCLLFAFGVTGQAQASGFDAKTVPLEHPANGQLLKLSDNPTLLVTGHNSEYRWLSAVDLTNNSARQLAIPQKAQFFQQANQATALGVGHVLAHAAENFAEHCSRENRHAAPSTNNVVPTSL